MLPAISAWVAGRSSLVCVCCVCVCRCAFSHSGLFFTLHPGHHRHPCAPAPHTRHFDGCWPQKRFLVTHEVQLGWGAGLPVIVSAVKHEDGCCHTSGQPLDSDIRWTLHSRCPAASLLRMWPGATRPHMREIEACCHGFLFVFCWKPLVKIPAVPFVGGPAVGRTQGVLCCDGTKPLGQPSRCGKLAAASRPGWAGQGSGQVTTKPRMDNL